MTPTLRIRTPTGTINLGIFTEENLLLATTQPSTWGNLRGVRSHQTSVVFSHDNLFIGRASTDTILEGGSLATYFGAGCFPFHLCRDPGLAYASPVTTQSYGEPRAVPTCLRRQVQAQNAHGKHRM